RPPLPGAGRHRGGRRRAHAGPRRPPVADPGGHPLGRPAAGRRHRRGAARARRLVIGDRRPDGTIRCVLDAAEVERYVDEHGLGELFDAQPRPHASPNEAVDPTVTEPKPPVWEDLVRLHRTIRTRRVTTVLEFGCGFSTTVMAHALAANKAED